MALLPVQVQTGLRAAVNWAGADWMYAFFVFTAWLGAIIESVVVAFMYMNWPILQAWAMYLMHGLFAFTAFDFSVACSGVLPLFAMGNTPGSLAASLGWVTSPVGRILLPLALLYVVVLSRADPRDRASHIAKLQQLSFCCRGWYFATVPFLYVGGSVPPGAMLLRIGTPERAAARIETYDALGMWAYAVVQAGAFVTCAISIINGSGPYGGWKTAGTYTTLYSNILVERDANHYIMPLVRTIRMPWCNLMLDLVTVTASDAPSIAVQLVLAPVSPPGIFADLLEKPDWKNAGRCHWAPTPPTWHTLLEYANPEMKAQPVLPYQIPYFQLRCLISDTITKDPDATFFVEYVHKGSRRRFSVKKGRPHAQSDQRLAQPPPMVRPSVCHEGANACTSTGESSTRITEQTNETMCVRARMSCDQCTRPAPFRVPTYTYSGATNHLLLQAAARRCRSSSPDALVTSSFSSFDARPSNPLGGDRGTFCGIQAAAMQWHGERDVPRPAWHARSAPA